MATDLSTRVQAREFGSAAELADALAAAVADDLRQALQARAMASMALSGGNTPKAFLQALSVQALDWSRVVVTLVDERWVPESDERSNAALLKANLMDGPAALASFVPLYRAVPQPEDALEEIERTLHALPSPFDVVVLGMGNDGHTASFFPGGDHLQAALDPACPSRVMPMRAPGAGEPRITLTLPPILSARHLYLHIEGAAKRDVLRAALVGDGGSAGLPIRQVLLHAQPPVRLFHA